jgi:hypothetical protein
LGGEAGKRLLQLNRRGKDRYGAAVGTMMVGLWGENWEGRSREGDRGRNQSTLVVRQTRDGQLWRGRLALVFKGWVAKKGEGRIWNGGGSWFSGSGRAKSKTPGGWRLRFLKILKWGLRLLWFKREHGGS